MRQLRQGEAARMLEVWVADLKASGIPIAGPLLTLLLKVALHLYLKILHLCISTY